MVKATTNPSVVTTPARCRRARRRRRPQLLLPEPVEQLALLLVELLLRDQPALLHVRQAAEGGVQLLRRHAVGGWAPRLSRGADRLLHGAPTADLELVLLLGVEQRLLEPIGVRKEADLARSRLGRGQQVDLAVADDPAEPRVANVHVGDRLQRGVVGVLVDETPRLDHEARRDEVALDPPHEEVPDEADQADDQRDPERIVEERADRPCDTVVRHPRVEGTGDEPDDEREDEPAPRLEEREPVALPYEQDPLTRGE